MFTKGITFTCGVGFERDIYYCVLLFAFYRYLHKTFHDRLSFLPMPPSPRRKAVRVFCIAALTPSNSQPYQAYCNPMVQEVHSMNGLSTGQSGPHSTSHVRLPLATSCFDCAEGLTAIIRYLTRLIFHMPLFVPTSIPNFPLWY